MTTFHTGTGFSIELTNYQLVRKGEYEGLPLYEAVGGQVTAIAIVEEPAIGIETIANSVDQTLVGPVMIPDLKIYRSTGPIGDEDCYWYFSADTIRRLQQSFKGQIKLGH